jgi:hypothetical protein
MNLAASAAGLLLALSAVATGAELNYKPELLLESKWSSDILLTESRLSCEQVATNLEWAVGVAYGSMGLEYRPFASFDALTQPTDLHRNRYAADLELRPRLTERLLLLLSGNYYYGFTDYRTAWLDEYYTQSYQNIRGYKKAYPQGHSAGVGARWEYMRGTGFLETALSYAEDDVAPGYEAVPDPDFHVVRSPGSINKVGLSISSENVVAPFMRLLNELAVSDSSERDPRFNYQISANIAAGPRWVFRPHAGYAREEPTFKAWYAGGAIEYDLTGALQVFMRAAYYYDSGEILDSLAISAAPPAIETYQVGLGLRYSWSMATIQLYAGSYFTRYDDLELGTMPFANLYRDRNWGIAQLAFAMQF